MFYAIWSIYIDSVVFEKVILIENLCWVNQRHFPNKTFRAGLFKSCIPTLTLDLVFLIEKEKYKDFLYI